MSSHIDPTRHGQSLLAESTLDEPRLLEVLEQGLSAGADWGDLFYESSQSEVVAVDDGRVRTASRNARQGVGVRIVAGDKQGFAHTDALELPRLRAAADAARAIADGRARTPVADLGGDGEGADLATVRLTRGLPSRYPTEHSPLALPIDQKVAALSRLDARCRAIDPRVQQVMAQVSASQQTVLVLRSDGSAAWDVRPLVRIDCTVIAKNEAGKLARGSARAGGRHDVEQLLDEATLESLATEAVRQALVNLGAKPAPAGVFDVVLGPGWPAVLLHEAVGHGLEGDFCRKGTSAFSGRIGEMVASELCTIVDDGSIPGDRGALNIDDEGTPAECTTLIENGRLVGYMQDRLNAGLMGMRPTGNGRRESYAHLTLPRMRNTYMRAGQDDPQDIIRGLKRGIYAVDFGGGQVDITSGKFVFEMTEAYLVEDGKIGAPLEGATLIGHGPSVLERVVAVGNDLEYLKAQGVCGKEGQSVPVGVGQPTLRVNAMTVGGSQV
ncbi:MAG: metalloprotease TldD [Deltaproteobacteria bacterium]|nr:metalloprotease TldD [Deltaproteobacteria bacterium]